MNTRLEQVLAGREDNCILPFLWQRGEDEETIRTEMARVRESGIRAVCVEARPHPDFVGPRWWHDLDIIMEEARSRDMRVWVLDDDHFPTGHAAGRLVGAPAALRRHFLKECHVDARGPRPSATFLARPWMGVGDRLVGVVAARRAETTIALTGEMVDITTCVQGDVVRWDVPAGFWRVFLLVETPTGGFRDEVDYINPLVPESVKVLIDTVYEPHFARYKADFGTTFAGFFSDEPGFYNDKDGYDYSSAPGKKDVVLPWCAALPGQLRSALGTGWLTQMPLLWHDAGDRTGAARFAYMDTVSRLYGQSFTDQVGDWCRAHGVEYIGHVLEDNGVHARLGIGAGHFFRALGGQDMSGIDVVLWQIVPGFDRGPFTIQGADADGEFYHYGLGKLGSSLAHVDPRKKGRTMCEVFGAYGWSEGLRLMKWMTDHMLVRGVNVFVPHAFSPAVFPDPDCPPHFWARGKNPQYRYYRLLNDYTNRLSHLLSGGTHVADVALLYHAEAEWSGRAMPFEKPLGELMRHQVDGDVIPADVLCSTATVSGARLHVVDETYGCLVVPWAEALPQALVTRLIALADAGLPLWFVNALPVRAAEHPSDPALLARLARSPHTSVVALEGLARAVREAGHAEISVEGSPASLRHYHVRHPGLDVFFFFNESTDTAVAASAEIPGSGPAIAYDAFANAASPLRTTEAPSGRLRFPLSLGPFESRLVLVGPGAGGVALAPAHAAPAVARPVNATWEVATATAEEYPTFRPWRSLDSLADTGRTDLLPDFSGTFRYETRLDADGPAPGLLLDLGEVFEVAEVFVNGTSCGVRLCPPYVFEIGHSLVPGANELAVEVTNTLGTSQRDYFSRFAHLDPSGLLGPVRLLTGERRT